MIPFFSVWLVLAQQLPEAIPPEMLEQVSRHDPSNAVLIYVISGVALMLASAVVYLFHAVSKANDRYATALEQSALNTTKFTELANRLMESRERSDGKIDELTELLRRIERHIIPPPTA